ncbi:hypothetical protein [Psychroflexus lacisalsi]|jgi:hypothetical protein|uniref:Glycerophosphoryl diester phosphodiesterase membrane domain-containing protein n=1 Tax=Psychroflexus lacisalsi TaxID=503928 RepID=A0ABP3VGZ5_9FLAO|nr:hypothetical protein [Psychroflexus lacisalsi]MBZ9619781.1 hypothetical protein [Psychroflexus lacisalsi]
MQDNYINFKKERDLGSIISDTFKFIRHEYKSIFRLYIRHVGWLLLLVVAMSTYYQYKSLNITGDFINSGNPQDFLLEMVSETGLAILLLSLTSIAYSALSITTINSIIKSYVNNDGEIKDEDVRQFIGQYFGNTLLSLIMVGILIFIGFLLCVLPGIYLIVPLSVIFPIIVFQEKSFSDAFTESFKLIKQNWWITFATLIVITLLIWLISSLFQLPIVIMSAIETFTSIEETGTPTTSNLAGNWLYMTFYVLASLAQYILGIVTLISMVFIYFNLNEYHNKTGTLEDIDRIGS